jgi:hypothetical protein
LRSALTTDYIESKTNQAIDDTTAWITKRSTDQPFLDLNDIKDQVLTAYPDAQIQIDQLQADLAAAQHDLVSHPMPVDGMEGLNADGTASTSEIAKLLQQSQSLNNFVKGDFRINLGEIMAPLYHFYQYYQIALPVIALVLILALVVFTFTTKDWTSRIKNMGWLLIVSAIVNGVAATIFSVAVLKIGLDLMIGMLPSQAEVAGSMGRAITQSLFAKYISIELTITTAMLVLGIMLLVGSKLVLKRQISSPTPTSPVVRTASESTITNTGIVN